MIFSKDKKFKLRWWTLVVMSVAVMITGLQNTITNVGLPSLQAMYQADSSTAQWFVNSYILAFSSVLLLMGFVGDKYGRKKTLFAGLIVFGAGSLMATQATTSSQFIVTQVIMGLGAGALVPQTLSIIVDAFPKAGRAKAIAIWTGIAGLGSGLGPVVGGWLLENYEVSSIFLINIPLVIFCLVAGIFVVSESFNKNAPKLDIIGTVLSAFAIIAIVFGFIAVPEYGWTSIWVTGAFLAGAVALVLFINREASIKDPLLSLEYFKNRDFVNGIVGVSAVFFALIGMMFLATQFFQFVLGMSPLEAGLLFIPMAVIIAVGSISSVRLAERFGGTKIIILGVLATAVGMALVSKWSLTTDTTTLVVTMSVLAAGAGLAMGPATNAIMAGVPEKQAGIASAINTLARQVSGAIGVALLGAALNNTYSDQMSKLEVFLPEEVAEIAFGSVGGALAIAEEAKIAGQLVIGELFGLYASLAFVAGMGAAMVLGTIVCLLSALYIGRHMKAHK